MFRQKNSNTKIENVEAAYNVELNTRGDTTLGNLLRRRGFQSQSQLLRALRGQLTEHASQKAAFPELPCGGPASSEWVPANGLQPELTYRLL
jgi:hypothetical protein